MLIPQHTWLKAEKFSRTLSTRVVAERAVASLRLSRKTFSFVEFENFSPENKGLYLQHDYLTVHYMTLLLKTMASTAIFPL